MGHDKKSLEQHAIWLLLTFDLLPIEVETKKKDRK